MWAVGGFHEIGLSSGDITALAERGKTNAVWGKCVPIFPKTNPRRSLFARFCENEVMRGRKREGLVKEIGAKFVIKAVRNNPSDFVCLCNRALVSTGARFSFARLIYEVTRLGRTTL